MSGNLRDVLSRELDAESAPPLGDLVPEAMRHGRRLRRRRNLFTACGAATGILAVLAVGAVLRDLPETSTTVPAADRPDSCMSAPVAPGDGGARGRAAEFSIFLREDATKAGRDDLAAALKADPLVAASEYESRQQAYTRLIGSSPDSAEIAEALTPVQLPESFRVQLKDPRTYEAFAARIADRQDVEHIVDHLMAEVAIFLSDGVTEAQRDGVAAALERNPLVADREYESAEQAYTRFQQLWRDSPDLVGAVNPALLPESFRVKLRDPRAYQALVAQIKEREGVTEIVLYPRGWECHNAGTGEGK